MCTKYKLSNLGHCMLGWEGRTGRTVLSGLISDPPIEELLIL